MDRAEEFYTMKGYSLHLDGELTTAMEDYLEMIARLTRQGKIVRVRELSGMLHVKASSVSKMVQQLARLGFVQGGKYAHIALSPRGLALGAYLLYRHDVLHRFLCALNHTQKELEQVEKIEHFLNPATIRNLEQLTKRLEQETLP